MQKVLTPVLTILFITTILSCRQSKTSQNLTNSNAQLEVLYFHPSQRCPACLAIENNTEKVLTENFKSQMDKGIIHFASYTIDDKVNNSLIEKYQISFSTLLLIKSDGTKTDFTNTAILYADTKPAKFEELLKAEIDRNLK